MGVREMKNLFSVQHAEERMSDANVLNDVDLHRQHTCAANTWSCQAKMRCGGIGVSVEGRHRTSSVSITAMHTQEAGTWFMAKESSYAGLITCRKGQVQHASLSLVRKILRRDLVVVIVQQQRCSNRRIT